jgi:hypothetical protein
MSSPTYDELKKLFKESEQNFLRRFGGNRDVVKLVVSIIAMSPNDNGWPLAMVRVLEPKLANALGHWTAGGYEDIRRSQEQSTVAPDSHAYNLEQYFSLLPLWPGDAQHVSKDRKWFERLECGEFEAKSFMGCCSPTHTFAYVSVPAVTLKFSLLKTARFVGALTTENFEGEILIPKGARFEVTALDKSKRIIYLEERAQP